MKKKTICTFMMCVLSVIGLTACGNSSNAPTAQTATETNPESENSTVLSKTEYDTIDEYLNAMISNVEENTSEMVDSLALLAKADAFNVDESEIGVAVAFIRNTYPNYFVDNATMEATMYYGCLLDYALDDSDIRSNLGADACQAVKYVYRKVETLEDQATQENLSQIQESLNAIP